MREMLPVFKQYGGEWIENRYSTIRFWRGQCPVCKNHGELDDSWPESADGITTEFFHCPTCGAEYIYDVDYNHEDEDDYRHRFVDFDGDDPEDERKSYLVLIKPDPDGEGLTGELWAVADFASLDPLYKSEAYSWNGETVEDVLQRAASHLAGRLGQGDQFLIALSTGEDD